MTLSLRQDVSTGQLVSNGTERGSKVRWWEEANKENSNEQLISMDNGHLGPLGLRCCKEHIWTLSHREQAAAIISD